MITLDNPSYVFDIDPVPVTDQLDQQPMQLTRVRVWRADNEWVVDLSGYKLTKAGAQKTQHGWPIYNPDVKAEALEAFLLWRAGQ